MPVKLCKHARTDHGGKIIQTRDSVMQLLSWSSTLSPRTCPAKGTHIKLPHHINTGPPQQLPSQICADGYSLFSWLPVALGAAFWAVDLIGRITRCKKGNCHPQTPWKAEATDRESAGWGVSQVGTVALESLKAPEKGLEAGTVSLYRDRTEFGMTWKMLFFLFWFLLLHLVVLSPIRTGSLRSDRAFLLIPTLCPTLPGPLL